MSKPVQGRQGNYPALPGLECSQRIKRVLDPKHASSQMIMIRTGYLTQSVAHSEGSTLVMILKLFCPSGLRI